MCYLYTLSNFRDVGGVNEVSEGLPLIEYSILL